MQQIVHGLRSGGSMDFDEISHVAPFIETAPMNDDINLDADQVAQPRVFKTHQTYELCPKGAGKYVVVVIRHPLDAYPSMYSFMNGFLINPPGLVSLNGYVGIKLSQERNFVFDALKSWWKRRQDDNVLLLFYEDMVDDLPGAVKQVAEFIGCGADNEELQKLVVKQASKDFMLAHSAKFNDSVLKRAMNKKLDLPDDAGFLLENCKVRGASGFRRKDLSPESVKGINLKWKVLMEELTGCSSYDELRTKHGRK